MSAPREVDVPELGSTYETLGTPPCWCTRCRVLRAVARLNAQRVCRVEWERGRGPAWNAARAEASALIGRLVDEAHGEGHPYDPLWPAANAGVEEAFAAIATGQPLGATC